MSIDVTAQTRIARPRRDVARFAMDAANDPIWIGGIIEARALTAPPMGQGAQVERVATFLGKRIEYVNEVIEFESDHLMVMRSIKGPFPMTITYRFDDDADDAEGGDDGGADADGAGATRAFIRVQGEAGGFYRLARPLLARAVRRSITGDLANLKDLLESGADRDASAA
jgi:hypothetical protein